MRLCDGEVFLPGNDFHLEVAVHRVDDVEFVDDGGDSCGSRFGEDDAADVVLIWEAGRAEVHMADVAYYCEPAGDVFYVGGESRRKDFLWTLDASEEVLVPTVK
jgi:hypothetical protein